MTLDLRRMGRRTSDPLVLPDQTRGDHTVTTIDGGTCPRCGKPQHVDLIDVTPSLGSRRERLLGATRCTDPMCGMTVIGDETTVGDQYAAVRDRWLATYNAGPRPRVLSEAEIRPAAGWPPPPPQTVQSVGPPFTGRIRDALAPASRPPGWLARWLTPHVLAGAATALCLTAAILTPLISTSPGWTGDIIMWSMIATGCGLFATAWAMDRR